MFDDRPKQVRGRTALARFRRRCSLALVLTVVAGCGTASPAVNPSTAGNGAASPSAAVLPSAPDVTGLTSGRPSPGASTVALAPSPTILEAVTPEPALKPLWHVAGPTVHEAWTWEPAIDPSGRIWAASSFDDVFWIIDPNGRYLESWGTSGTGPGQFRLADPPNGFGAIAFRSDGGFYVADTGNSRVEEFDSSRAFVKAWGSFGTDNGQFTDPIDIATDAANNVYVYSDARLDVQEFTSDGSFLRIVATHVGPYIAVAADGTVYAVQDDPTPSVQIYATDGRWTRTIDLRNLVQFATGVAVTADGHLLIASSLNGGASPVYQNLIELAPDGSLAHVWPSGGEGIAVSSSGDRVYLTYSNVTPIVQAYALPPS